MNLIALPAFTYNCIWMLHDGRTRRHATGAGAILVTHHHASSISRELELNPILRVADNVAAQGLDSNEPVAVSAALRQWKNDFR